MYFFFLNLQIFYFWAHFIYFFICFIQIAHDTTLNFNTTLPHDKTYLYLRANDKEEDKDDNNDENVLKFTKSEQQLYVSDNDISYINNKGNDET